MIYNPLGDLSHCTVNYNDKSFLQKSLVTNVTVYTQCVTGGNCRSYEKQRLLRQNSSSNSLPEHEVEKLMISHCQLLHFKIFVY